MKLAKLDVTSYYALFDNIILNNKLNFCMIRKRAIVIWRDINLGSFCKNKCIINMFYSDVRFEKHENQVSYTRLLNTNDFAYFNV